jgi:hypothetical protein
MKRYNQVASFHLLRLRLCDTETPRFCAKVQVMNDASGGNPPPGRSQLAFSCVFGRPTSHAGDFRLAQSFTSSIFVQKTGESLSQQPRPRSQPSESASFHR